MSAAVEIAGPDEGDWCVVSAMSETHAVQLALRRYHARKTRERRERLDAENRCKCGRDRDRDGKLCSVCWEGQHASRARRRAQGFAPGPRDEAARVGHWQERRRELRETIRLEVLQEVRGAWQRAPHTLAFAQWLAEQIGAALRMPGEPKGEEAA